MSLAHSAGSNEHEARMEGRKTHRKEPRRNSTHERLLLFEIDKKVMIRIKFLMLLSQRVNVPLQLQRPTAIPLNSKVSSNAFTKRTTNAYIENAVKCKDIGKTCRVNEERWHEVNLCAVSEACKHMLNDLPWSTSPTLFSRTAILSPCFFVRT